MRRKVFRAAPRLSPSHTATEPGRSKPEDRDPAWGGTKREEFPTPCRKRGEFPSSQRRGGASAVRLTRRRGQFGPILNPSGLTTPSAPSLRSAQPPLLCEEGCFAQSFSQYRP